MLFKYVISGTPSADTGDFVNDVAKLFSGETDVNNLSAHCDKTVSGFHADSSPIDNPHVIELAEASRVILKRPHPDNPAVQMWGGLEVYNTTRIRTNIFSDATGGVEVNKGGQAGASSYTTAGTVVYIIHNKYNFGLFFEGSVGFSDCHCIWPKPAVENMYTPVSDNSACPYMQSAFRTGSSQDYIHWPIVKQATTGSPGNVTNTLTIATTSVVTMYDLEAPYASDSFAQATTKKLSDGTNGLILMQIPISLNDSDGSVETKVIHNHMKGVYMVNITDYTNLLNKVFSGASNGKKYFLTNLESYLVAMWEI